MQSVGSAKEILVYSTFSPTHPFLAAHLAASIAALSPALFKQNPQQV
jgi:hypothetical protein